MKIKKFKSLSSILFILFLLIIGYSIFKYQTNQPLLAEIKLANETFAHAKRELAGKYAIEKLNMAETYYKQAISEWKIQNSKIFLFRDYIRTRDLALKAFNEASSAGSEAGTVKLKLKQNIEDKLNDANSKIERFEKYYKNLPIGRTNLDLFNKGSMSYLEALHEFEKADYKRALKSAYTANEMISQAEKSAHLKLVSFYSNYNIWQNDIQIAYNLSKKGETVILVDKMQAKCSILKGGKEYRAFPAEFGINWMGHKLSIGDSATPEGVYRVTAKKNNGKTKYYKALLLNYPNERDKQKYNKAIKDGVLSQKTHIGGLIEIHGTGGKGINWTEGCIALENKQMDIVYDLCQVNTPVIIVGSSKSLEDYFNSKTN